jgi:hypothetical protein
MIQYISACNPSGSWVWCLASLMLMKHKKMITGISMSIVIGLALLSTASVVVSSISASNNCADIDCLKEQLKLLCETDPKPDYLDCQNILRCMDAGEQEIMSECIRDYAACNSHDLLARSWCDYTRGDIPK